MKNLLLQLIGLIVASLESDRSDSSRIEKIETATEQLKKDIAAVRGDSAFADPEVQSALDAALAKAQAAELDDDDKDGDGIPDALAKQLDAEGGEGAEGGDAPAAGEQ